MKTFSLCVLLAIPLTAYAQQSDVGPMVPAPAQEHQQVTVRLQVMELSLTKLKSLGIDVTKSLAKQADVSGDPKKQNAATAFSVVNNRSEFLLLIESLRKRNLVKVLAEPTLVTIAGREATFHAGGKVPVPVPQKDGSQKTEYRPYGTEVRVKPVLLANRRIRLDARCRVSELDHANSKRVGNETVPGIRASEIHTVAEIENGRTLVVSGPNQVRIEACNYGLPGISEIPYVGAMFRTVKETRNETMTLVMITPTLAEPLDKNARVDHAAPAAAQRATDVNIRR